MVSHVKIMGALTYRAMKALREDKFFLRALPNYLYYPDCFYNNLFRITYFVGTEFELFQKLSEYNKTIPGLKFPALCYFLNTDESVSGRDDTLFVNLAFVARTNKELLTQQRDIKVFDTLLRPMYHQFMREIDNSGWFLKDYGYPNHSKTEVFTTGKNQDGISERFTDYVDAIQVRNLSLTYRYCYNDRITSIIEREYNLLNDFLNK